MKKNMFIKTTTAVTVECPLCHYEWTPRIDPAKIKSCPECKCRIGKHLKGKG